MNTESLQENWRAGDKRRQMADKDLMQEQFGF
jgi:hypothetical protein